MKQLFDASVLVNHPGSHQSELRQLLEVIERTPVRNTVKGMYVSGIVQALSERNLTPREQVRYQAFKDYSLRDYMKLCLDAGLSLYPGRAPKHGLRSLGQLAIPTFAQSISGAVVMGTVGRSWELALRCVSRGYQISLKPGQAIVAELTSNNALVQLRSVWNFGDSYQVGVVEGLMDWCGLDGEVVATTLSASDTDLTLRWDVRDGRSVPKAASRDNRPGASP
jgi:uncharacterized protein (TIGR02265 family)